MKTYRSERMHQSDDIDWFQSKLEFLDIKCWHSRMNVEWNTQRCNLITWCIDSSNSDTSIEACFLWYTFLHSVVYFSSIRKGKPRFAFSGWHPLKMHCIFAKHSKVTTWARLLPGNLPWTRIWEKKRETNGMQFTFFLVLFGSDFGERGSL